MVTTRQTGGQTCYIRAKHNPSHRFTVGSLEWSRYSFPIINEAGPCRIHWGTAQCGRQWRWEKLPLTCPGSYERAFLGIDPVRGVESVCHCFHLNRDFPWRDRRVRGAYIAVSLLQCLVPSVFCSLLRLHIRAPSVLPPDSPSHILLIPARRNGSPYDFWDQLFSR
jgi:hypothetical protein